MAKLVSPRAELAALRAMCSKEPGIAGAIITNTDESYFYSPESVEIYEAIKKYMATEGSTPTYKLLIEDPELSEEAREHFRNSQATVQSIPDARKAARILDVLRKRRGMYNIAVTINESFKGSTVNLEKMTEDVASGLNIIRSKKSNTDSFLHFGRNNNSKDLVEDILWGDNEDDLIPTGIKAFDDRSGGAGRGGLWTLGASSGGGKSLTAGHIGKKIAAMGYKVLMVPLEMSKKEMTQRMIAHSAKMDLTKIITQRMTEEEKALVYKRQRNWEKKVKMRGGRYTIFKPNEDMTIEEIFLATGAYDYDIKIIDYISLLKGTDGDNMWQALGNIARTAKINAEIENCVNLLLVQVNEEGKIKYSRAITEHSNLSWIWTVTKEQKETGIITIEQAKSRNSNAFPFKVKLNWAHMTVEEVSDDYQSSSPNDTKKLPNLASDL